jgi:hypothetical protein
MKPEGTLDEVSAACVQVLASVPVVMAGMAAQLDVAMCLILDQVMPTRIAGGDNTDTAELRESLRRICGTLYANAVLMVKEQADNVIAGHLAQHAMNKAQALAAAQHVADGQALEQ